MNLTTINDDAILPALGLLGLKESAESTVMMLAIGLQESRFTHRRQMGSGPAMGFWQFERGGGVRGVLNHHVSAVKAASLCNARRVPAREMDVWKALENDDVLAAGFARLLLLTDPRPLPGIDDTEGAWKYYLRNWRPGRPHRSTWDALHAQAQGFVA